MLPISPLESNIHVEKLLDKLKVEFFPEIVDVRPEEYSVPQNCFINVEKKVKIDGGSPHYGWAILQSPIICEAERHAVWKNPDGVLIDVTPREPAFERIMFVSQDDLIYRGQLIDNVRINITDNPIVDDYIFLCETVETLYTYGTRLNDDMLEVPQPAQSLIFQYEDLKTNYQLYMNPGAKGNTPCICGSGKKYKNCHGRSLRIRCTRNVERVHKALGHLPRPLMP